MPEVDVEIIRFVDSAQPGVVECRLLDAWGKHHTFVQKVPIFTIADLTETSAYPQQGALRCSVIRRWQDPQGREIVTVDTSNPDSVESTIGQTQFDVLTSELAGS